MPRIEVNHQWCKGCYICIEVCPKEVLGKDEATFVRGFHPVVPIRPEECIVCRQCELLCPDLAIMVWEDEDGLDNGE